jgi:hypothetical protein
MAQAACAELVVVTENALRDGQDAFVVGLRTRKISQILQKHSD